MSVSNVCIDMTLHFCETPYEKTDGKAIATLHFRVSKLLYYSSLCGSDPDNENDLS